MILNPVGRVGEGIYKSFIRLLPWFIPQIAIAAFLGSGMRASNKIVKPALETTKGYKRWWGKAVKNVIDQVDIKGEVQASIASKPKTFDRIFNENKI